MPEKRVLFIVSNDFGEMSLVTIFSRNQSFCSLFAIPEYLYKYFDEEAGLSFPYTNIKEISDKIESLKPDIVLMFSAYLYTNNALATRRELSELRILLSHNNINFAISDPFGRMFDTYPDMELKYDGIAAGSIENEVKYLTQIFKNTNHLYGYPFRSDVVKVFSFYNRSFAQLPEKKSSTKKYKWLFVLSSLDLKLQLFKHGESFHSLLIEKFSKICDDINNIVYFVAPEEYRENIDSVLDRYDNIHYIEFCTLREYENIVRNSNVVFYWNVFSNSLLLCLYYGIPMIFLDKGHVACLNDEIMGYLTRYIFPGSKLDLFSLNANIDSDLNQFLRKNYSADSRTEVIRHYKSLKSPASIINSIIDEKY